VRPQTRHGASRPPESVGAAWFRYRLRRFLRFSERAARTCGVTPQQHQLLLGVAGYTGRGWATITELAEFLQERHNAVVGLVQRATRRGLVRKEQGARDRRFVRVRLTRQGTTTLHKLTRLHFKDLRILQGQMFTTSKVRPQAAAATCGAPAGTAPGHGRTG
jgi:DNA-binding MarR family transcriptional regulator